MTNEQRKKLIESHLTWVMEWFEVDRKGAETITACDDGTATQYAFMAGAEAGHAIRDEEVERLRKANEVMRAALDECRDYMVRPEDTRGVAYFPAREALTEADKILGGGCPPHSWDRSGERCEKCGDKDWMT